MRNVICDLVFVTYDIGPSLSPFVAKVVKKIKESTKVEHQLTPMGSILEGSWDDVMELVTNLFNEFASDYERLGITLKIDYRRSKTDRIKGKVESVLTKISSS